VTRRLRPATAWIVFGALCLWAGGCGDRKEKEPRSARGLESLPSLDSLSLETPRSEGLQPLPDAPLRSLEQLLALPRTPEVELDLGTVYLRADNLDSAIVHYRRGAEGMPGDPAGWNYLGIALARAGRYEEANEAYDRALQADAYRLETHINLGNLHFRRENWDAAIREYRIAATIDSTDAKMWLNLGLAYDRAENTDQAGRAYRKAALAAPLDPLPWELLGNLYYRKELYAGAADAWEEAAARDLSRQDLVEHSRKLREWQESLANP